MVASPALGTEAQALTGEGTAADSTARSRARPAAEAGSTAVSQKRTQAYDTQKGALRTLCQHFLQKLALWLPHPLGRRHVHKEFSELMLNSAHQGRRADDATFPSLGENGARGTADGVQGN